jgi:hypothetical protein
MPNKSKLSIREKKFIELLPDYGVICQAGIAAGFTESYSRDRLPSLCRHKSVLRRAIAKKEAEIKKNHIADAEERQRFWTQVMGKKEQKMGDRLHASELLGKSQCDFKEINLNLNADIPKDPEKLLEWHKSEIKRLEASKNIDNNYQKALPAIAKRY